MYLFESTIPWYLLVLLLKESSCLLFGNGAIFFLEKCKSLKSSVELLGSVQKQSKLT